MWINLSINGFALLANIIEALHQWQPPGSIRVRRERAMGNDKNSHRKERYPGTKKCYASYYRITQLINENVGCKAHRFV
jgi:hypothetical protein